jgi:FkbM family methyltransferase
MLEKILTRLKLLRYFNTSETRRVNGKKVIIPVIRGIRAGETEPWMLETIKKLAPVFNGGFVDVGVNTGQTLLKAWSVFEPLQYIGFEPNAVCVNYVKELVEANGIKNVTIIPVGIGNRQQLLKLNYFYNDDIDGTASLVAEFRPEHPVHHFQYVPVFDYEGIKELLPQKENAILKIDVEGGEAEVLEGLKPWIAERHPVILVEILPAYNKENQVRVSRQHRIEALAAELGYGFTRIVKTEVPSLTRITEIGIHDSLDKSDYLLYHQSVAHRLPELFTINNA